MSNDLDILSINFMRWKQSAIYKSCWKEKQISRWCIDHNFFWCQKCIEDHSECYFIELDEWVYLPSFLISIVMMYSSKLKFIKSWMDIKNFSQWFYEFKTNISEIQKYSIAEFAKSSWHSEEIQKQILLWYSGIIDNSISPSMICLKIKNMHESTEDAIYSHINDLKINVIYYLCSATNYFFKGRGKYANHEKYVSSICWVS